MSRKQRRANQKRDRPSPIVTTAPSVQALFEEAVRCHQAERLAEAEQLYRQILCVEPRHSDSLNLLGLLAHQVGRHDIAVDLIGQAITINGTFAPYYSNLGLALQALGRPDEAAASYRRALAITPDLAEAHCNLGVALQSLGRPDQALDCYRRALEINPGNVEAHTILGTALHELGRLDEAADFHRRAIALKPDHAEAYTNLGLALQELGRPDEAAELHREAVRLKPDLAEAHSNLGNVLNDLSQPEEAAASYRRALAIRPDFAMAHCNLGSVQLDLGRLAEAEASCRRALAIKPNFALARTNLGITLLAAGDFTEGWREYEWRRQASQLVAVHRDFAQPQWQGEAGDGRTLLIHAEQGFGDTLQFCRYAPLAALRGWRVILEVQTPLVRLMGSLAGVERVMAQGEPLPDFDRQCPMLSLPLALGTTLDTIPAAIPYLHADQAQVAVWRARLAALPASGRRVGLVWAGNPSLHMPQAAAVDRRRSIPADRLTPLADLPGLHFFSLQKGGPAAPAGLPLTDVMAEMADFADTAALIANLDLVVSVDTAVAHLAGALGKPVWLLNRFDTCWRWLRRRDDSPWYPTLRQFRQPKAGDWAAVIEKIIANFAL